LLLLAAIRNRELNVVTVAEQEEIFHCSMFLFENLDEILGYA